MSLGVNRLVIEKVTHSKSKNKKFVEELNRAMSPEAIAAESGKRAKATRKK